jgi:hypothetical protein
MYPLLEGERSNGYIAFVALRKPFVLLGDSFPGLHGTLRCRPASIYLRVGY